MSDAANVNGALRFAQLLMNGRGEPGRIGSCVLNDHAIQMDIASQTGQFSQLSGCCGS